MNQMILDMMGRACPQPVIEAQKWIHEAKLGDQLVVLVDNAIAVDNLKKLAQQRSVAIDSKQTDTHAYEVIFTIQTTDNHAKTTVATGTRQTCVVIASDVLGVGDRALGEVLMNGFFLSLTQLQTLPTRIIFYNSGVKLTIEGSKILPHLECLQRQGVENYVCGTCLNHYELVDQLAIGDVTNMYQIVEWLSQADHIIRPA